MLKQGTLLDATLVAAQVPRLLQERGAIEEIRKHGHVLTPGRYVGAAPQDETTATGRMNPFEEKMARISLASNGASSKRSYDQRRYRGWTPQSRRIWRGCGFGGAGQGSRAEG